MEAASGIVTLPVEILTLILEHITDRSTLLSLCRSCSTLRREAEVYLYASINTREIRRHIQFLSTITTNPQLASLVRGYRSHGFGDPFDGPFGQSLKEGLQAMTKLKDLDLTNIRGNEERTEFLKRCGFQLKSFAWRGSRITGWNSVVSDFLRQQHSLERLILVAADSKIHLPPDVCQNLLSLSGSLYALEAFLPGRRVTTLNWIPEYCEKFTPEVGSRLAESFNHLRTLSIVGYSARPHLSGIADHLCMVEVLELFSLKPSELLFLPKLPRLNNMIFSFGPEDSTPGVNIEDHADVVECIFTTCGIIGRVDIQYKRMAGCDFFICWIDNMRRDELEWKRQAWRGCVSYLW